MRTRPSARLRTTKLPVSGLMSWNRYPSKEDTAIFRDAGLTFYSFMGNLCLTPEGVPDPDLDRIAVIYELSAVLSDLPVDIRDRSPRDSRKRFVMLDDMGDLVCMDHTAGRGA